MELTYDYDKAADVLYLTYGEAKPCIGRGREEDFDLLYRTSAEDDTPNGMTILNFYEHWTNEPWWGILVVQIANFFDLDKMKIMEVLNKALAEARAVH
jgi:hypothetical protein